MIYLSAPLFITEIRDFVRIAPDYFDKVSPIFDSLKIESLQSLNNFTQGVTGGLENVSSNIFNALAAFFGGLASAFFILSLSFFLSLEDRSVEKFLLLIAPKKYESYVLTIFEKSQAKVSGWFGARVIACLFVAIASFAVFYFFGIQYSFILAFLAGVLNFVPFIGALIVGILLVVLIGISDSLMKALIILGLFAIIQQLENQIISPVLTKKFIGLPPVLVLLSLVAGGMVFGFLGAVFAVPVFGILYEFIKEFLEKRKEDEVDLNIIS
jgi:predicted PurR-regulated permease PerM